MKVVDFFRNIIIFIIILTAGCYIFVRSRNQKIKRQRDPDSGADLKSVRQGFTAWLQKCTEAWNVYQRLEPEKNEIYHQMFSGNGRISECIGQCCSIIRERLNKLERTEDMQTVLYGSGIFYLDRELERLEKCSDCPVCELRPDEFRKYLEKQHIELDENNLEPTVECLKDIYRDIQNNIEEERRKKVRREKFIQTEKELRKGRAAELLNVLRNPGSECTPQQYLTAADELERVLTDIRRNCRNV